MDETARQDFWRLWRDPAAPLKRIFRLYGMVLAVLVLSQILLGEPPREILLQGAISFLGGALGMTVILQFHWWTMHRRARRPVSDRDVFLVLHGTETWMRDFQAPPDLFPAVLRAAEGGWLPVKESDWERLRAGMPDMVARLEALRSARAAALSSSETGESH